MTTPMKTNGPEILAALENRGTAKSLELDPIPQDGPTIEKEGFVIERGAVSMKVLWVSPDGTTAHGLWEAEPGVVSGVFLFDENDVILKGRMTIHPTGGEPLEVHAGDSLFVPNGSWQRWEIHDTVRKAFCIHNPDGLPLG